MLKAVSYTHLEIPETIVYYSEVKVKKYSDMMKVIPSLKKEYLELNPKIKCTKPPYEFCEYLDKEHKETDIMICRYEMCIRDRLY